ncbi:unnamed protein product [Owenia fusiformis]|uniref:Uncharacterized protein n=1 Tax=Owenia fusiformis TaxID=6347 RepID=A0A8J1XZP6_OWEFU|nr:unnamed protein product [Owenia fusiformis]
MPEEKVVPPGMAKDIISRDPASKEEMAEIIDRLNKTTTVSKRGGEDYKDKAWDYPKTPNLGSKMLPIIDGLDDRFKGGSVNSKETYDDITGRLHTTRTKAASLRYDYPRILLYPERTTLMNNTQRIVDYNNSGAVAKQKELARRERWYN